MTLNFRFACLTVVILLVMYQYFVQRIKWIEHNAIMIPCVTSISPTPAQSRDDNVLHHEMIQEDSGTSADGSRVVISTNNTYLRCLYDIENDQAKRYPSCVFDNLYLDTRDNVYYTLRLHGDPVELVSHFQTFDRLAHTQDLPVLPALEIKEMTVLAQPPHPNYCHGFLEDLHCMFWELTMLQGRRYGIDPKRVVYWITRSSLFDEFPHNWDNLEGIGNGYIRYKSAWRNELHSAFSSHDLGFSGSHGKDNRSLIHFRSVLVPGHCSARSPFVNRYGLYHESRTFPFEPFSERTQGKWMLLFGDYLLRHFKVPSKFQATTSHDDELIVITSRRSANQREITNPRDLQILLQDNPMLLRVVMYEFGASMVQTMQVMRSTRLLITPHGAGMSNMVFMRPGAAVLETDGFRCDYLGVYYGQLANILNIHHRMWTEMRPIDPTRTACNFNADIELDVREIASISEELLIQENHFRDAHFRDAVSKIRAHDQDKIG